MISVDSSWCQLSPRMPISADSSLYSKVDSYSEPPWRTIMMSCTLGNKVRYVSFVSEHRIFEFGILEISPDDHSLLGNLPRFEPEGKEKVSPLSYWKRQNSLAGNVPNKNANPTSSVQRVSSGPYVFQCFGSPKDGEQRRIKDENTDCHRTQ